MSLKTLQSVMKRVANEQSARNALLWLLSMQTVDERIQGLTKKHNGAGFSARITEDGKVIVDDVLTATNLLAFSACWTDKQNRVAQDLLWKYRRQLVAHANGCNSQKEVAEFKLSALYNEDSRLHKNYQNQLQARKANDRQAFVAEIVELEARLEQLKKAA